MRSTLFRSIVILTVVMGLWTPCRAQTGLPPETPEIDALLARAIVQHQAGDLLGAIENYREALDKAPDRADIRSNLGAALVALGRFAQGIDEYRTALAGHEDVQIRQNLALALYKAERTDEAIGELERVLQAEPGNRQAALVLADCLLQAGRVKEVIDLLSPREAAFPEDMAYAYLLGTALLQQGETQRGEVLVDRIFRKGESAEGHLLMGMAHLNKRNYQLAASELARSVELNPSLATAQVLYGRAILASGDRERAARAFRKALEIQPSNFEANLQLGNIYRLEQRYEDAMRFLKRAEASRAGELPLRHAMAATYLALGDAEKAREILEGVVKEAPSFVDGHVLLATTYYRLKRKEEGDRERQIIERLNAENQARQPGAMSEGPSPAQSPQNGQPGSAPSAAPTPQD
jgi:Tfp pilus assembly protein PilF